MLPTQICNNCGEEEMEYRMHPIFTGRSKLWLCNKCYQTGEREATLWEMKSFGRTKKAADHKKER